jgi:hypothetical protein
LPCFTRKLANFKNSRNNREIDVLMKRQHRLLILFCLTLSITSICLVNVGSALLAGVKKGNWIEYRVSETGTAPAGHDVVWARMEVTDAQNSVINVKIETQDASGNVNSKNATLNLETGDLGEEFIIPANLNVGDTFFDKNSGNVTIVGSEKRAVAGAERTLLYAESGDSLDYWDQVTGVLIEGRATMPGFTMTTDMDATNMWQPQSYTAIVALAAFVLLFMGIGFVIFAFRRKRTRQN